MTKPQFTEKDIEYLNDLIYTKEEKKIIKYWKDIQSRCSRTNFLIWMKDKGLRE